MSRRKGTNSSDRLGRQKDEKATLSSSRRTRKQQQTASSLPQETQMPLEKRRQMRAAKQKRKKQQMKIAFVVAAVCVVFLLLTALFGKNGQQIYVGDTAAVVMKKSSVTAEDFTKSVEAQLAGKLGTAVQVNETIRFEPVRANKKDLVTTEYALSRVCELVTYQVQAAVITVDGAQVQALATQAEAQSVLDSIISEYVPEGTEIVEKGFVENVEVVQQFVDSSEIVSTEEAYATLTAGTPATQTYTVISGDTLSKIADKNKVTVEEILEANPTITLATTLNIGDKLNLNVTVPYLSVKTAENVVYTEVQEKEVEYREDASKPSGYRKVVQQGKDGQKEVTSQIIRVNGFETEQKVISEKTTVEPVTEIIVVGTN